MKAMLSHRAKRELHRMQYTISVDTGGTFTDVVVTDESGSFTIGKSLTTKNRIFEGIQGALRDAATQLSVTFEHLIAHSKLLIYGTTRSTNAIVTRTTAKTAFVTTSGFGDLLLLREGGKTGPHDFSQPYPEPYVPRRYTFEVKERISSEGKVTVPLDEPQLARLIDTLAKRKFEAVAVCLIWSIANPAHERRIGQMLDERLPGVPYTLSHRLIPIVREYRRASATAIDASLKPLMQRHLQELESDIRGVGFTGELLVSTTAGGCNYIQAVVEKPIYTVGSGPAMAPIAGLHFSQLEGLGQDVIVCDTGGTTFDVGLVRNGHLTFTRDTWIGPAHTGDLLGISAVDMRSIGAGGGSIAWIDDGGLLRVGPQSAGADPGPACYGRGGTLPTVSDAATVLGYLDPEYFLAGRMKLDRDCARRAVATVAGRLRQSPEQTAFQIIALAGDNMMRAVSDVTINEGVDPRESCLVAGGGAAGLNIMMIARELGCRRVVLPKVASALSASGMQYADIVAEESASVITSSGRFAFQAVNEALAGLADRLQTFRAGLGKRGQQYRIEFSTEARYHGQVWDLEAPLARPAFETQADVDDLVNAFHQAHERVFSVRDEASPVEFINWRARLIVPLPIPPRAASGGRQSSQEVEPRYSRDCYFGSDVAVRTGVYDSRHLVAGALINGPAIVEEPTTTLVIFPGMSARVSEAGNYVLNVL
jgi:N-methylhydantoinase A